jgi:hypothetical protein
MDYTYLLTSTSLRLDLRRETDQNMFDFKQAIWICENIRVCFELVT